MNKPRQCDCGQTVFLCTSMMWTTIVDIEDDWSIERYKQIALTQTQRSSQRNDWAKLDAQLTSAVSANTGD